jgi:magnesium-transporting ATPase (P-type)
MQNEGNKHAIKQSDSKSLKKQPGKAGHINETHNRLQNSATVEVNELFISLETTSKGLDELTVEKNREKYGNNKISHTKKTSLMDLRKIIHTFVSVLNRGALLIIKILIFK